MENYEYFVRYLHKNINYCLDKSLLLSLDLKLADATSVCKKKIQIF